MKPPWDPQPRAPVTYSGGKGSRKLVRCSDLVEHWLYPSLVPDGTDSPLRVRRYGPCWHLPWNTLGVYWDRHLAGGRAAR